MSEVSLPKTLFCPTTSVAKTTGLDDQLPDDWERHDPSNVIKHEDQFLLWVTEHPIGKGWDYARIILLSSLDGIQWQFEQVALEPGNPGDWDEQAALTPYIVPHEGRFYLFYSGVDKSFTDSNRFRRGIGYVVADSPFGPWKKEIDKQILMHGERGAWDELNNDDTNIIYRDGKWWFYYKGRMIDEGAGETFVGVATADKITGPYTKHPANPLFKGHAFTVTKFQNGVIALPGANNQKVLWSSDGLQFNEACDLKHKSTGVYNPADFDHTAEDVKPIEWIIDVLRQSPRRLYRLDCQLG